MNFLTFLCSGNYFHEELKLLYVGCIFRSSKCNLSCCNVLQVVLELTQNDSQGNLKIRLAILIRRGVLSQLGWVSMIYWIRTLCKKIFRALKTCLCHFTQLNPWNTKNSLNLTRAAFNIFTKQSYYPLFSYIGNLNFEQRDPTWNQQYEEQSGL